MTTRHEGAHDGADWESNDNGAKPGRLGCTRAIGDTATVAASTVDRVRFIAIFTRPKPYGASSLCFVSCVTPTTDEVDSSMPLARIHQPRRVATVVASV